MSRWDRLLRSRRVTGEVRDEIRAHLDERVDDLVDAGVPEAEAYRRARLELGNAARAIEDSRGVWASRLVDQLARDLHGTWRGLRARRGRALLSIALLAIALAANTIVFAVADSLVFDRVPYPNAGRLVTIAHVTQYGSDPFLSASMLDAWRAQKDLFESVESYVGGWTFLLGGDHAEQLDMASITPGLLDTLGVHPRWGRSLTVDDAKPTDEQVVLIGEALARRRFGTPDRALGQRVETSAQPFRIVGVMPANFAFPTGRIEIWRALEPAGPLVRGYGGASHSIALARRELTADVLREQVAQRGAAVDAAAGYSKTRGTVAEDLEESRSVETQRRLLVILLGASSCLLLTAGLNVLGLELTRLIERTRTLAIQSALGAGRHVLIRVAVWESIALAGVSAALAWALAVAGISILQRILPEWLRRASANPIDLDVRAFVMMAIVATASWVIGFLPAVRHVSRTSLTDALKQDSRIAASSKAATNVRRAVTVAQIGLASALTIVGALYIHTYARLLGLDKGFDSSNLVSISAALPGRFYPSDVAVADLEGRLISRLRGMSPVMAVTTGPAPPSSGNSPSGDVTIGVDGQPPAGSPINFAVTRVPPEYLHVLRVPLRAGRWFAGDEPLTSIMIGESFARRYWPNGDAIGHTFREYSGTRSAGRPEYRIVGVFGDYRTSPRDLPSTTDRTFFAFTPPRPPAPPDKTFATFDTGGFYRGFGLVIRLNSRVSATAVLAAARAVDRRLSMDLDFVDDLYAQQHAETLLATRVVGLFGIGAFVMAMAGLYGVMAFLVAGRTREIGIRMALGADRARIGRFVMGSSLRLVFAGAALGIVAASLVSRAIASQLFGVTPTDPATYVTVAIVTIATASLATWQPARRAARVDPVQTLRAE